jgi:hypothetical protein
MTSLLDQYARSAVGSTAVEVAVDKFKMLSSVLLESLAEESK